jgi:hypothetical protein
MGEVMISIVDESVSKSARLRSTWDEEENGGAVVLEVDDMCASLVLSERTAYLWSELSHLQRLMEEVPYCHNHPAEPPHRGELAFVPGILERFRTVHPTLR